MLEIALRHRPHAACLVPERREERTTEGGLDAAGQDNHLLPYVARLAQANIRVSLFIEPDPRQIEAAIRQLKEEGIRVSLFVEPEREVMQAACDLGAPVVELHTGTYCDAVAAGEDARAAQEFERLCAAAAHGAALGLEIHAGHGLDYDTARAVAAIPEIVELNIGHFLIGEAVFVGLEEAVRTMRAAMDEGRARAP